MLGRESHAGQMLFTTRCRDFGDQAASVMIKDLGEFSASEIRLMFGFKRTEARSQLQVWRVVDKQNVEIDDRASICACMQFAACS